MNSDKTEFIKFLYVKNEMLNFEMIFSGIRVSLVEDCKIRTTNLQSYIKSHEPNNLTRTKSSLI